MVAPSTAKQLAKTEVKSRPAGVAAVSRCNSWPCYCVMAAACVDPARLARIGTVAPHSAGWKAPLCPGETTGQGILVVPAEIGVLGRLDMVGEFQMAMKMRVLS